MTENKRYYIGNGENCTICDSNEGGSDFYNMLTQFEAVDRLNEQEEEIKQLKEFKNKVFKEINTELSYLTEKAMDNPVNHGRIKALKELKRCVE